MFSVEERVKMLCEVTGDMKNVKIVPFEGLLIEFARQMDAKVIIRGLRAVTDFEYELPNVIVEKHDGLLVDFAKQKNANILVRGLRAVTDFEYELQIAQTNHKLNPEIETLFMTTSLEYSFLSSSTVRELASFGGDISQFVPKYVEEQVIEKMKKKRRV